MSRPYYDVREDYLGTGALATYTFDFKIERAEDLLILKYDANGVLTNRVRGTDIGAFLQSVTFDMKRGAGSITLMAPLPTNHRLILLLANDEPIQSFEFKSNFDLSLERIEAALDWVVGPIQRLVYRMGRVMSFPDNLDLSTFSLEIPAPQTGKVLAFKADGTGFEWVDPLNVEVDVPLLPAGGLTGDVLVKISDVDQDADWKGFGIKGFSSRFSEQFDTDTLEETLAQIIKVTYTPPSVSFSASGSGTLREKGASVSTTTLTANITKRSDPIAAVRFYKGATLIHTVASPNPAGGTESYVWTGTPFTDNETFSVQVDDDGTTGGPTTVSASATFSFVYPYFNGAAAVGANVAAIQALTKSIIASTATLARTMVATNGQVFYFAYPSAYGALTSILDINNFETFPDWTRTTRSFVGLDGTSQSYYVYEFNNPVTAGSYTYTFKR